MRVTVVLLLFGLFLTGCGYDPEQPAYNTKENSEGFPPTAIALLDNIEGGSLGGYTSISEAFAELYTSHSELLDNQAWSKVITRLGSRFRLRADSLSELGISHYSAAAGFYQLATFANPVSGRAARRAGAFGLWLKAAQDQKVDLSALEDSAVTDIEAILGASRYFLLTDSLHQSFYRDYLSHQLERRLRKAGRLSQSSLKELAPADRAMVNLARLDNKSLTHTITTFADTTIDLVACRIVEADSNQFSAEVYIVPQQPISDKIVAVLRIGSEEPIATGRAHQTSFTQVDLNPIIPASSWKTGEIVAFAGLFHDVTSADVISFGLYDCSSDPGKYLKPDGSQDSFIPLDSTVLVLR